VLIRPTFGPRKNRLLEPISEHDWAQWIPHLEQVDLYAGQTLHDIGDVASHAYFPVTATVSLLNIMQDGAISEVALVGNDGMVGASLFFGNEEPSRAIVLCGGKSFRISARAIRRELKNSAASPGILVSYLNFMMAQMAHTAQCNLHHSIEQRFCRRLLLGLDRSSVPTFPLTQQGLADALGVRRESVTNIAQRFQTSGAISYRRGCLTILDREQLERKSCECYLAAKLDYYRPALQPERNGRFVPMSFPSHGVMPHPMVAGAASRMSA
jgi:CRP-like cAMP-binding protein